MGGWFRKEINTLDDLKGLKFRVGGFAGIILQRLGVVPQQIAGGDIYPHSRRAMIDAAEWVGPHDDEKLGFVKVAKYYYYPGWWELWGATPHYLFNLAKWNELPKIYQAAILAAGQESGKWMTGKYDHATRPHSSVSMHPVLLKPFPPEVMDGCHKAATELTRSWRPRTSGSRSCSIASSPTARTSIVVAGGRIHDG